jgi:catechol 2,3-dioxygenase-like lactoylglutathione lyase family enzyme
MARIRHLAIKTADPERLGKFYAKAFDMEIIHRAPNGGVFLTDGYLTLALLRSRPGDIPPGINHFGFQVDDTRAVCETIEGMNLPTPLARPSTRPYAELRGIDPDGNLFDISEHGYAEVETADDRQKKAAPKKERRRRARSKVDPRECPSIRADQRDQADRRRRSARRRLVLRRADIGPIA